MTKGKQNMVGRRTNGEPERKCFTLGNCKSFSTAGLQSAKEGLMRDGESTRESRGR